MKLFAGCQGRGPRGQHNERAAGGGQGGDDKARNGLEHRKQHQLFVGTKNGEALLDELPTPRELTHRALLRNRKQRNSDLRKVWREGPALPIVRSMHSFRTGNGSDKSVTGDWWEKINRSRHSAPGTCGVPHPRVFCAKSAETIENKRVEFC